MKVYGKLTSGLSQPIISPYDTWWHRQYVGSLGSTGMSKTSDGCTDNRESPNSGLKWGETLREKIVRGGKNRHMSAQIYAPAIGSWYTMP